MRRAQPARRFCDLEFRTRLGHDQLRAADHVHTHSNGIAMYGCNHGFPVNRMGEHVDASSSAAFWTSLLQKLFATPKLPCLNVSTTGKSTSASTKNCDVSFLVEVESMHCFDQLLNRLVEKRIEFMWTVEPYRCDSVLAFVLDQFIGSWIRHIVS